MKDIWEILEIEPTSNKKEIRKAYSELVKKYHPEDDPVGYKELRDAYEIALNLTEPNIEKNVNVFENHKETLTSMDVSNLIVDDEYKESTFLDTFVEENITKVIEGTKELLQQESANDYSLWVKWFKKNEDRKDLIFQTIFEGVTMDLVNWHMDESEVPWENVRNRRVYNLWIGEIKKIPMAKESFSEEKIIILQSRKIVLIKKNRKIPLELNVADLPSILFKTIFLFSIMGILFFLVHANFQVEKNSINYVLHFINSCFILLPTLKVADRLDHIDYIHFRYQKGIYKLTLLLSFASLLHIFTFFCMVGKLESYLVTFVLLIVELILLYIYQLKSKKGIQEEINIEPISFKTFDAIILIFIVAGIIATSYVFVKMMELGFSVVGFTFFTILVYDYIAFRPVNYSRKSSFKYAQDYWAKIMMINCIITCTFGYSIFFRYIFRGNEISQVNPEVWIIYFGWIITIVCSRVIKISNKKMYENYFAKPKEILLFWLFNEYCENSEDGKRKYRLNDYQKKLMYIYHFINDMKNGGFKCFYQSNNALYIDIIIEGLKAMGAEECVRLISESKQFFDDKKTTCSFTDRNQVLVKKELEADNFFTPYDSAYENLYASLEDTIYQYVLKNKNKYQIV